jgi:hypothetical protein
MKIHRRGGFWLRLRAASAAKAAVLSIFSAWLKPCPDTNHSRLDDALFQNAVERSP